MPSTTFNYSTRARDLIQEAADFANASPAGQSNLTAKQYLALAMKEWVLKTLAEKALVAFDTARNTQRQQREQEVDIT